MLGAITNTDEVDRWNARYVLAVELKDEVLSPVEQTATVDAVHEPSPRIDNENANSNSGQGPGKRSTERGEGREKLITEL